MLLWFKHVSIVFKQWAKTVNLKCYKNKWTIGPTTADSHCRWTSTQALLFLFHCKRRQLLKSFVLWC